MFKHHNVLAFCFTVLFSASIPFLFPGCRRAAPPPPSGPLKLQIIYHEKNRLHGINVTAVDGIEEFVFRNTSTTEPLTIKMPPTEIFMLSSDGVYDFRQKLEESAWPKFARSSASFTLQPGRQRVFTNPFNMGVVKLPNKNEEGANLCLVFGPSSSGNKQQDAAFTGKIVSESFWDDSQTVDVTGELGPANSSSPPDQK